MWGPEEKGVLSRREVHTLEKWAGLGALQGELPAGWGAGCLHPYTGTPGLGLQAGAVTIRGDGWWERKAETSAPGLCLLCSAQPGLSRRGSGRVLDGRRRVRTFPRGTHSSCVPHRPSGSCSSPSFFLLQLLGSSELRLPSPLLITPATWPSFHLNIKSPFSPHPHFCLFVIIVAKLCLKKLIYILFENEA